MPPMQFQNMPTACFAPPLSDETLARYEQLAQGDGPVPDAMRTCLKAAKQWWDLPESKDGRFDVKVGVRHKGKDTAFNVRRLEQQHIDALDENVPWAHELEAMKALFDSIDPVGQKELRDAAHHLLWHAIELCHDREPLTQDKLP